jgi:hypothetical protein
MGTKNNWKEGEYQPFKEVNPWKRATGVLACLVIMFGAIMIYNIFQEMKYEKEFSSPEKMCSRITATPSWMDKNGNLVSTGVQNFGNSSSIIVNALINQTIYFLYNPSCGACKAQIEFFGQDWERYKESGFAVDCTVFQNGVIENE